MNTDFTCLDIVWQNGQWVCHGSHTLILLASSWLLGLALGAVLHILIRRRNLVAAIDDLNANIATLNTTIASAVTALGTTGVPQAAVEAAATAVAGANATLLAAIPQAPAPTP